MPAYTLQFRVPEALSADIARSRFFWTQDSIDSVLRYIVWVTKGDGVGSLPAMR